MQPSESSPVESIATSSALSPELTSSRHLRLWPGATLVAGQWLLAIVPGWLAPGSMAHFMSMFWGPILTALGLLLWWSFASRLRWTDRVLGVVGYLAALVAAFLLCVPSFRIAMGMYGLSALNTAWIAWLLLTAGLAWPIRRAGLIPVFLLGIGWTTLLRLDGTDGTLNPEFSWRWAPTAEDRFLAARSGESLVTPKVDAGDVVALQPGDWPGFRGPARDSKLTGVRIPTDWKSHPPRELWRQRVGPGWSSFIVLGDRLITQEQRGPDEAVVCYDAATGAERWAFTHPARFSEVIAGPGPRATPTFHGGRLYVQGASGWLHCLDAATGKAHWSRDLIVDTGATTPQWGFSASPLVFEGLVITFAGAPGKSLAAYHCDTGEPAWAAGEGQFSYCSPHLARFDGIPQVLITSDRGMASLDPRTGTLLWQHDWMPMEQMARVVQPALVGEQDALLGTGFSFGTRRLRVQRTDQGWTAPEVWQSKAISPYFNDLVIHDGHIYGFDNQFFTCVALEDGAGKWRARGYGNGQVLLLADQGLLLILSERGDVALVEAKPDRHVELGKFKALTGKTWNHPVVAHGKLFVRNGEEMVCYAIAGTGAEEKQTAKAEWQQK